MKAYDTVTAALALMGFVVLGWVSTTGTSDYHRNPSELEAELRDQARLALKQAGHEWAEVTFDGQRARLSGIPFSDAAREEAVSAVLSSAGKGGPLWGGVVSVEAAFSDVVELPEVSLLIWQAEKMPSGQLVLSGHVPSERVRSLLVERGGVLFGGIVRDEMVTVRGKMRPDWVEQAQFILKELSGIETGYAEISGRSLKVSGIRQDDPARLRIETELAALPEPWVGVLDTAHDVTEQTSLDLAPISGLPDGTGEDEFIEVPTSE